jgi:hypothetical protein
MMSLVISRLGSRLARAGFAACALLAIGAQAASRPPSLPDGNELLALCQDPKGDQVACAWYIAGVADAYLSNHQAGADPRRVWIICRPTEATSEDVKRVVISYLASRPDIRYMSSSTLIGLALSQTWPCPEALRTVRRMH